MDSEFKKKVYEKLTSYEKGWKNWEWSNLILWMQDLKYLFEKSQALIFDIPTTIEISKRLSLCLNPSLPQGIHLKALEIYSLLLSLKDLYQLKLLLLGLLSYFPHSSDLAKLKFIEIIENIKLSADIIEPMVFALLQGTEEKGPNYNKLALIIDRMLEEFPRHTHASLWRFLLKSKRNKLSAMMILKGKPFNVELTSLAINAILAGIADENIRVKRHALDIVKATFPISSDKCSYNQKLMLMTSILLELNSRDSSLCRRLWEWTFPSETQDFNISVRVITDAFFHIKTVITDDLLVMRTAELIMQGECPEKIFEAIGLDVLEFAAEVNSHCSGFSTIFQSIFSGNERALFRQFTSKFLSVFEKSEQKCWNMISVMLAENMHDKDFCYEILEAMLLLYTHISEKHTYFELCIILSSNIDRLPDCSVLVSNLYNTIVNPDPTLKPYPEKISNLLINLGKSGLNYKEILLDMKVQCSLSRDKDFFSIISFISNFEDGPISSVEIQYIWKKLLLQEDAHRLILKLSQYKLQLVRSSLTEILVSNPNGVSIFLKFWHKSSPEDIKSVISDGVISIVINMIESNEDLQSWIHSVEHKAFLIVDFLILLLLDPSTQRTPANGIFVYKEVFNTQTQVQRLRTLGIFLSYIDHIAIESLQSLRLSSKSECSLSYHSLAAPHYIYALTKILLLYLSSQPFSPLTVAALECLEQLMQWLPVSLLYSVVRTCFKTLEHAIAQQNISMQLQILTLVSPVVSKLSSKYYVKLCNGTSFINCLLQGCFSPELTIRGLWQSAVISSFAIVLQYSQQSGLVHYVSALIAGTHHYIMQYKDFSLLGVVRSIMHMVLGMDSKDTYSAQQTAVGIRLLESCIRVAADCWGLAKTRSIEFFIFKELENIFYPIGIKYTYEIVKAYIGIWGKYCQLKRTSIEALLGILPTFQLSIETILDNMQACLNRRGENERSDKKNIELDVFVAHLLMNLLQVFKQLKLSVLSYQMMWYKVVNIIKILIKSPCPEVPPLLLKVFSVLEGYADSVYSYSDNTLKKEIKEIVGNLLESMCRDILKYEIVCITLPYPDVDVEGEIKLHELCLQYMIKYSYTVAFFACIGDITSCGLYLSNACLSLLFSLPSANVGKRIATEVILTALRIPELKVADKIKKEVIELINMENFFVKFHDCIENFGSIIREVSKQCYVEKNGILGDVLNFYSRGWISAEKNPEKVKKCILRLSLVVFSGDIDDYLGSFYTIEHYLKECFKIYDLLPEFLLLLKVLLLKFNKINFSDLWIKFLPEIHIILIETLETSSNFPRILDALRFYEFLVKAEHEECFKVLYCYAADVPEIQEDASLSTIFTPVVIKRFITGVKVKVKWSNTQYPDNPEIKSARIGMGKSKDYEEIDKYAKSFIQFCICCSSQVPISARTCLEQEIEKELLDLC